MAQSSIPIPFVVLLLKLDLETWGYYVAGALFLGVLVVGYTMELGCDGKARPDNPSG